MPSSGAPLLPYAGHPRGRVRTAQALPALTVAGATMFANLLSYAVLLVAAGSLGSRQYGQLVAVLGILTVAGVPALAVQTVAARRAADGPTDGIGVAAAWVAAASTGIVLALAYPVARFVRLPNPWSLVIVGATVPGLVVIAMAQGLLQGRRRFSALAVMFAAAAVARLGAGLIGIAAGRSMLACMTAMLVGTTVLAGAVCALGPRSASVASVASVAATTRTPTARRPLDVIGEIAHAAHAHGVLYVLSALDLLLARHVLPVHQAAVYAGGAVLARAALWLPQSVATLAFAALTNRARQRQVLATAAAVVLGIGAGVIAVSVIARGMVARVVGSGRYPALAASAWVFALVGTALAVLALAVVAGLAVRRAWPVAVAWSAGVAEVIGVLALHRPGVTGVALVAAASTVVAAGVAMACSLVRRPALPGQATEDAARQRGQHEHHRA